MQCDLWLPHEPRPVDEGQNDTPGAGDDFGVLGIFQAQALPSRTTPDLLGEMWILLQNAPAVPAEPVV
jgi:hypothetical protein